MAIPLTQFQEPGFFSQVTAQASLSLLPGAFQVVALIGAGSASKAVLGENATRVDTLSANPNDVELLANQISSITRVYSASVFQYPVSSYSTSITGTVDATSGYSSLATTTLILSVNGGAPQTVTFSGSSPVSLASTVTQCNAVLTGCKAVALTVGAAEYLKIMSASPTGDGGKQIQILAGTANTILGFTANAYAKDIDWAPSFASSDASVRPLDGTAYLVDYMTNKVAADFAPQFYFSQSSIIAAYGAAQPGNTLSLGGNAAFGNGASIVVCRQLTPSAVTTGGSTLRTEVGAALADLELVDVDLVVPMVADSLLWPNYLTHVSKMSSQLERKERMCIVGLDETAGRIATLGNTPSWQAYMAQFTTSGGLTPKRMMVVNPGSCLTTPNGTQYTVDGTYLAACLAGMMVSPLFDVATSMTYKQMATVDALINPELARSQKNLLTGLGVTVIELANASIRVRRSLSADGSNIAYQEPSITRAFDRVASQMRTALENRFMGTKIIGASTVGEVVAAATTFLDSYVAQQLISDYQTPVAAQNATEPRQIDLTVAAQPVYPFLWGSLQISITL